MLYVYRKLKKEFFNAQFIKKICPHGFDSFQSVPYVGASGGSIILWNNLKFSSQLTFQNNYAQSVEFQCQLSGKNWILTNKYAPCTPKGKLVFLDWFKRIEMSEDFTWLIVCDFNLIRSSSNRNKPGGNIQEMLKFNEEISRLRRVEISLKGYKYTWTNKQQNS